MARRGHRARARGGFTLVEMIVAILILTVGVLGLAGTAMYVTRMVGGGAQQTLAAGIAQSQFEALRASSCASARSDSAVTRGISSSWTVTPVARGLDVTVRVRLVTPAGTNTRSFRSLITC
jgi:prepilin-type N-terminal cleavage/methylation domain-containing protein